MTADLEKNGLETYSESETRERAERTLKAMLATPHKPHKAQQVVDGDIQAKTTRPKNERVTPCD